MHHQKFWKNNDTNFILFQQLAYKRIKRLAGSHKEAIRQIEKQEAKAQEKLEQITRTCCGILRYIDMLRFMQKIPDTN